MKSRIALSIAPVLMFAFGQQAHADTTIDKPTVLHTPGRLNQSRHGKTRTALLGSRHSRHIGFRHLAIRHVEGRHIAYGHGSHGHSATSLADADGWNPVDAGVSPPPPWLAAGASVHLTSFETPASPDAMLAASQADNQTDIAAQTGIASYYGGRHNGRRTSSGLIFNEHEMTAAHATLPFGTKVLVRLPGSDRSVVVTITDRLYSRHRIIDLSEGAAERLGIIRAGTALVMLTPEN